MQQRSIHSSRSGEAELWQFFNTMHNLDVVARADWIIDMGPGAGAEGGKVVFEGAPRELLKASKSLTGKTPRCAIGMTLALAEIARASNGRISWPGMSSCAMSKR